LLAVDIDRQAIERRDFPIGRRGYDPAAVDAHLRALAAEFEELQRASTGAGAEPSLASTAATQVQSILTAAETAAADIEHQALQNAKETRERADRDAERTREGALEQARAHVAAVAQATAVLLERVSTMDGEVDVLVESVRTGAGRLAGDLAAVQTNMGELYDAASGRAGSHAESGAEAEPATPPIDATAAPAPAASASGDGAATPPPAVASSAFAPPEPEPEPATAERATAERASAEPTPAVGNGDLDSARLIALNMALNGESRADADRYLSENFKLADRQKLIDEVYAAIEG
jgi:DivIVA domain-containing protein